MRYFVKYKFLDVNLIHQFNFYLRTNLGHTCCAPGPPIRMLFIAEGLFGSEFI